MEAVLEKTRSKISGNFLIDFDMLISSMISMRFLLMGLVS